MNHIFTLNIESINEASFTINFTGSSSELSYRNNEDQYESMVAGTSYGPLTKYVKSAYPDDHTVYPGGQVSVMLMGQQCGPATNQYRTVLYLGGDSDGHLNEVWVCNVSMTPAAPRSGSRAQFATFTAAYASETTTPSLSEVMSVAMAQGAEIKLISKGQQNTWSFDNGQCFQINLIISNNID